MSDGFTTTETQTAELLKRTANRVIVAVDSTDNPQNHDYAVSYVVRGDSGSKDITSSGVEFVDLGDFTITFRTA